MELCLALERNPGLQLSRRWWEHPTLDILGIRVGNAAVYVGGVDADGVIGGVCRGIVG